MAITTSVVAIYGAVLSTIVFVRDTWSRRRRARVFVGWTATPGSGFVLVGSLANTGREPIFIESCNVARVGRVSLGGGYTPGSDRLPAEVKPGQSIRVAFPADAVYSLGSSTSPRVMQVTFVDQVGNRYRSGYFTARKQNREETGWSLDDGEPLPARKRFANRFLRRRLRQ